MEEIKNTNIISLEELEWRRNKTTINYKDIEGNIKSIEVYNPTEDEEQELSEIILKNSNLETKQLSIPSEIVISKFMRMLTNITFTDDEDELQQILKKPSGALKKVMNEITETIIDIMEINMKMINNLSKIMDLSGVPKDKLIEMLVKNKEIAVLEEKLKQEQLETKKKENKLIKQKKDEIKTEVVEQPEKKKRGRKPKVKKEGETTNG